MTTMTVPSLAPDATPLTRLSVALKTIIVLGDDPANPVLARQLHLACDRETYQRLAERMREHPEWRRIVDERKTVFAGTHELERFRSLPEGTLGRAFAQYYIDNGIEPFYYDFPIVDDIEFLAKRYRETHDIHHIITGYGTDAFGENELQAFYAGNMGLRHSAFIALVSTFSPRGGHEWNLIRFHRRLYRAFRRGRASAMLLGVPFDELWESPVSEIGARYIAPAIPV
jgi:ubiquinone biosynthesis protein COQ4